MILIKLSLKLLIMEEEIKSSEGSRECKNSPKMLIMEEETKSSEGSRECKKYNRSNII